MLPATETGNGDMDPGRPVPEPSLLSSPEPLQAIVGTEGGMSTVCSFVAKSRVDRGRKEQEAGILIPEAPVHKDWQEHDGSA